MTRPSSRPPAECSDQWNCAPWSPSYYSSLACTSWGSYSCSLVSYWGDREKRARREEGEVEKWNMKETRERWGELGELVEREREDHHSAAAPSLISAQKSHEKWWCAMVKKPLTDNKSMSSNPFWRERKENKKKKGHEMQALVELWLEWKMASRQQLAFATQVMGRMQKCTKPQPEREMAA